MKSPAKNWSTTSTLSTFRGAVVTEMDRVAPQISLIHRVEGPELAALNLKGLLQDPDLLPGGDPES